MRTFYNPTASFESSLLFDGQGFFPARANMRCESKFISQSSHLVVIIALVQTESLRIFLGWIGTRYLNVLQRFANHFHIVSISAFHCYANWHARSFGKQTSLGTVFRSVCRIGPGFFPRLTGLYSWLRPSIAKTNSNPLIRRNSAIPAPRIPEIPLHPPILESAGMPKSKNRYPSHPAHSIDNLCEERKEWRPSRHGLAPEDCGLHSDAAWAEAKVVPFDSRDHREHASHRPLLLIPFYPPMKKFAFIGGFVHIRGLLK